MTNKEAITVLRTAINNNAVADVNDAYNYMMALEMAIKALKQMSEWIPADKELPEEGEMVLCWYEYFRYGNYNRMCQTYGTGFQYRGYWGGDASYGSNTKVLYWMPLPEPPEGAVIDER